MDAVTALAFSDELRKIAFSEKLSGRFMDYLASEKAEHHGDLSGLALMALSSADKLQSQLRGSDDHNSLVGGDIGRTAMDLVGLGLMTAPTVAALTRGSGSKLTNALNLAGLTTLVVPTLDKLQASVRGRIHGVDPETKMLMSHNMHTLSELAGMGLLSIPVAKNTIQGHYSLPSGLTTLAGYATLSAPLVSDLISHGEEGNAFHGPVRTMSELAGLGLLAAGAMQSH